MFCQILVHHKIRHIKNKVSVFFRCITSVWHLSYCGIKLLYGGFPLISLYLELKAAQEWIQQGPHTYITLEPE